MMRRRNFITLLGGAAAWPLAAHAQQPMMPTIGFLSSLAQSDLGLVIPGFQQGLNGAGLIEGRNIAIEYRWAEGDYQRLPGQPIWSTEKLPWSRRSAARPRHWRQRRQQQQFAPVTLPPGRLRLATSPGATGSRLLILP